MSSLLSEIITTIALSPEARNERLRALAASRDEKNDVLD
jgi:hypothetical protein